jgi:hypothetical protein
MFRVRVTVASMEGVVLENFSVGIQEEAFNKPMHPEHWLAQTVRESIEHAHLPLHQFLETEDL